MLLTADFVDRIAQVLRLVEGDLLVSVRDRLTCGLHVRLVRVHGGDLDLLSLLICELSEKRRQAV